MKDKTKNINQYRNIKGLEVQFKGIKGTVKQVSAYQETYYADNIKYYEELFYKVDITTEDGYEITIKPLTKRIIEKMYKIKRIIEENNLQNGFIID